MAEPAGAEGAAGGEGILQPPARGNGNGNGDGGGGIDIDINGGGAARGAAAGRGAADSELRRRKEAVEAHVPTRTVVAYALPGFATTSLSFLIAVYLVDFYVANGVGLPFLSFFTAMARSFDVITDPVMGWVSDTRRWAAGRRRPFMAAGCVAYALLFVALFSPPALPQSSLAGDGGGGGGGGGGAPERPRDNLRASAWFGVFYVLFYLSDTLCNVPYEALGPELTDSYDERDRVFFAQKVCNFMGIMFGAAAPAVFAVAFRPSTQASVLCRELFGVYNQTAAAGEEDMQVLMRQPGGGGGGGGGGLLLSEEEEGAARSNACCVYRSEACPVECVRSLPAYHLATADGAQAQAQRCESGSGEFCFRAAYADAEDAPPSVYFEVELDTLDLGCLEPVGQPEGAGSASGAGAGDAGAGVGGLYALLPERAATAAVPFEVFDASSLDAQRLAFLLVALVFGLYYVGTIANLVLTIRERSGRLQSAAPQPPLVPSILRAFKNIAFRPLLLAWALDGLGLSALVTMFPFFVRYVVDPNGIKARQGGYAMGPQTAMGVSVVALLITAVVSTPVWLYLSKRYGKYRAWVGYNAANVLSNLLFFWPSEGDPGQTLVVMALNGIPVGGQFLINSILADVVDYDEFLNGCRSEGSFSVFGTLIPKFVAIPANAIPLMVINVLGFRQPIDGVTQPQTEQVKGFIRYTFILLPFCCSFLGMLIKLRFPIKTKAMSETISAGIKAHAAGERAPDPLTGASVPPAPTHLAGEEARLAWLYENFSEEALAELRERGAGTLVARMRRLVVVGAGASGVSLAVTMGFINQLGDPKMSIMPVMGVIVFGMSSSFLMVNASRLRDARAIARAERLGETKGAVHKRTLEDLQRRKSVGQAGGAVASGPRGGDLGGGEIGEHGDVEWLAAAEVELAVRTERALTEAAVNEESPAEDSPLYGSERSHGGVVMIGGADAESDEADVGAVVTDDEGVGGPAAADGGGDEVEAQADFEAQAEADGSSVSEGDVVRRDAAEEEEEGASEGAEVAAAGEEAVTDLRRESDAGGENL